MENENVRSPAEGVTPETEAEANDSQSEAEADDAGTETLDAEGEGTPSEDGDEGDADPEGDDASSEGEEGNEVEEIELNFGGEKLRVPKGAIPDEVVAKVSEFSTNLEAGYTKKFQEVAETRKSLESRETAIQRAQELQGEALTKFSTGLALQKEIAQLRQVDVNALWQSNPDQARQVSDTLARKEAELANTVSEVSRAEAEAQKAQETETARRFEEGKALIERRDPAFTKELPDVIKYAVDNFGIDQKTAESEWALNPPMALAVRKAMLYDRMQAKTVQKNKPAPQKAKPIGTAKGKGGAATPDLSSMTPAQMAKHLGLPG